MPVSMTSKMIAVPDQYESLGVVGASSVSVQNCSKVTEIEVFSGNSIPAPDAHGRVIWPLQTVLFAGLDTTTNLYARAPMPAPVNLWLDPSTSSAPSGGGYGGGNIDAGTFQ